MSHALTRTLALVAALASSSAIALAQARARSTERAAALTARHPDASPVKDGGQCGPLAADYSPLLPLSRLSRRSGGAARRCSAAPPTQAVAAVPLLADSELLDRRASFRVVAVTLRRRSDDVVRLVEPGSGLRHCDRDKVVSIGAYDIVAGVELDQAYTTVWRLNGRVKAVTHFRWPTGKPFGGYVLDRGGGRAIEDGRWHVALRSGGETIGATDVSVRVGGRC